MFASDDFLDRLADVIHEDLFEPWREIDAWITRFCPCSLTLVGTCSVKNNRGRSIRRRVRRATQGSKSNDPDGPGGPSPDITNVRRPS
jgi:hypothetical protein